MTYLALALAALLPGPAFYRSLRDRETALRWIDRLVYVTVPVLVLWDIVPAAIAARDPWPALALLVGVFGPVLIEHSRSRFASGTDVTALVLGISGLSLHALLEGAALTAASAAGDITFLMAVIFHRLPVGLVLWWLVRPRYGLNAALLGLGALLVLTALGFAAGVGLEAAWEGPALHRYQAFVGGTLLHVVTHGRLEQARHGGHSHA